jgi:hypothetical protein
MAISKISPIGWKHGQIHLLSHLPSFFTSFPRDPFDIISSNLNSNLKATEIDLRQERLPSSNEETSNIIAKLDLALAEFEEQANAQLHDIEFRRVVQKCTRPVVTQQKPSFLTK